MTLLVIKYLLTAALVVVISEVAKRSDKLGALLSSLPIVTILVLLWLFVEKESHEKLANHAWYTFWYVLPTLPMFALFPYFLTRYGFGLTMLISIVLTLSCFIILALVVRRWGIELF